MTPRRWPRCLLGPGRRLSGGNVSALRTKYREAPLVKARRRMSSEAAETVGLTFVDAHGAETTVRAAVGKTVLDAALVNDIDIEAACGGEMACSTCHVILDSKTFDSLDAPTEEEQDMLDLAWGLTDTSRLCCQIKVSPELDGTIFTLPDEPSL